MVCSHENGLDLMALAKGLSSQSYLLNWMLVTQRFLKFDPQECIVDSSQQKVHAPPREWKHGRGFHLALNPSQLAGSHCIKVGALAKPAWTLGPMQQAHCLEQPFSESRPWNSACSHVVAREGLCGCAESSRGALSVSSLLARPQTTSRDLPSPHQNNPGPMITDQNRGL